MNVDPDVLVCSTLGFAGLLLGFSASPAFMDTDL